MNAGELALRRQLIDTVRRMNAQGLNQGTAGNASVRCGDGLLLTPSGVPYEHLVPADLVLMGLDGRYHVPRPGCRPSSEWRFHRDILAARPDLGAVLHTHGVAATTLACARRAIPAFHYMVAVAGGHDIRCAGYATFGTQALSDAVLEALRERRACLIANHGMIAAGENLAAALALAVEVETLAEMYWRCLQIGEPVLLDETQMAAVLERFEHGYGAGSASDPEATGRAAGADHGC